MDGAGLTAGTFYCCFKKEASGLARPEAFFQLIVSPGMNRRRRYAERSKGAAVQPLRDRL